MDKFFSEYQDKIDYVNGRIKRLYVEVTEFEDKFEQRVTLLDGETDDNFELIQDLEDNVKNRNNRILEKFRIIEADLDTIRALIKDIDDSKINKLW